MKTQIEYRVRPVTRYIVTRFEQEHDPAGQCASAGKSTQHGEFDVYSTAYAVGYALAKAEHDRLGLAPSDEQITYPEPAQLIPADRIGDASGRPARERFMTDVGLLEAITLYDGSALVFTEHTVDENGRWTWADDPEEGVGEGV